MRNRRNHGYKTLVLERPTLSSLWRRLKGMVIGRDQEMEWTRAVLPGGPWPETHTLIRRREVNPRPRKYMTQKEVAEYTGLDQATIHRWRMDGTIPGYLWRQLRPSGKVMFEREAFISWWDEVAGKKSRRERRW